LIRSHTLLVDIGEVDGFRVTLIDGDVSGFLLLAVAPPLLINGFLEIGRLDGDCFRFIDIVQRFRIVK
jgi:hypothetical protein